MTDRTGSSRGDPGRWARLSLRVRVTLLAAVAITSGLLGAVLLLVLSLRSGLVNAVDDAAQARAVDAASALRRGDMTAAVSRRVATHSCR